MILLLDEALTIEEIALLMNLCELRNLLEKADFDPDTRDKLGDKLDNLTRDTISHSKTISEMIKTIIQNEP